MRLEILRFPSDSKQTLGIFQVYDGNKEIFKGVTLELADKNNKKNISRIKEGEYKVVKRWSEKYGNHFHVLDVYKRDYILIHSGNYYTDTNGCILPGEKFIDINGDGNDDITNSQETMNKLNKILPDEFDLIIVNSELIITAN